VPRHQPQPAVHIQQRRPKLAKDTYSMFDRWLG
jgi:hypothetical protein